MQLAERDAPGAATLQLLHGRVRLVTGEESWELGQGDHLQLRPRGTGWSAGALESS
jgi:quercetin dioxygenase-like cupin family protein